MACSFEREGTAHTETPPAGSSEEEEALRDCAHQIQYVQLTGHVFFGNAKAVEAVARVAVLDISRDDDDREDDGEDEDEDPERRSAAHAAPPRRSRLAASLVLDFGLVTGVDQRPTTVAIYDSLGV